MEAFAKARGGRRVLLSILYCLATPSLAGEDLFRDITEASGIRFHQTIGAAGKKHLFETMVGGAAWIDIDRDGALDLYIVQAHSEADHARRPGKEADLLYRNRGDGTFEDVTERAGVGDRGYGGGAAVGDYDNDGDSDLYITNYTRNTLYRNRGDGTFEDVTEAAGVTCPLWSASAAFSDLDRDGFLDLYVANYVDFDPAVHGPCFSNGVHGYCHPNKFNGLPDTLYRNRGDGTFEDFTRRAGVAVAGKFKGNGLGVLPTDFDGDGDVDIFVAADSVPNRLWRNLGGFRFEDAAIEAGVALSSEGKALAGMGIDGGDVNGDGLFDYYITNFARESNSLFLGDPSGYLIDGAAAAGVAAPTYLPLGFGCKLLDFDLDGDLDIFTVCGHTDDSVEISQPRSGQRFAQPDLLLENDGRGNFRDISAAAGDWFRRALVGRGAAFGDFDNDGDLDVFIVHMAGPGILLRNGRQNGNHWLGVELGGDGRQVNRDGFGAVVTVIASSGTRRRFEVRTASSYLSANDHRVNCGLGKETEVDRVEVDWPNGTAEAFSRPAVDAYHRLVYGRGKKLLRKPPAREVKR